jgi:hypothetical protein
LERASFEMGLLLELSGCELFDYDVEARFTRLSTFNADG